MFCLAVATKRNRAEVGIYPFNLSEKTNSFVTTDMSAIIPRHVLCTTERFDAVERQHGRGFKENASYHALSLLLTVTT